MWPSSHLPHPAVAAVKPLGVQAIVAAKRKEESGNFRFAIQMAFDCAECWPNQLAKCSCTSSQEMSPWLSSSRSQTCKIDQVKIKRGNESGHRPYFWNQQNTKNTSLSFAKVKNKKLSFVKRPWAPHCICLIRGPFQLKFVLIPVLFALLMLCCFIIVNKRLRRTQESHLQTICDFFLKTINT